MRRPLQPPPPPPPEPPDQETPPDRLDSWKEIAAFLKRDVRTVQRWEKQAGLPVHRHPESRLRTAFAYRSELDAWWRAHEAGRAEEDRAVPSPPFWRRPWRIAGGVTLAVILCVIAAALGLGGPSEPPVVPSRQRVLLAHFEAPAAHASLMAAIEKVVQRELQRHDRAIEIVAPSRIRRTLRLMKRAPETVVTAPIGREIALRDGDIPLVLTGRLRQLESGFVVDVDAIGAVDGSVRTSVESQGKSEAVLLAGLKRALRQLVSELSHAQAPRPAERLEPVSTGSLQALRLYTAAVQAGSRRQWRASELLARRAIATDPEFAAAQSWVGWAMRRQGQPRAGCLEASTPARRHSNELSDREIYLIGATEQLIQGQAEAAIASLEALLRVQPADRLASDMLIEAYSRAGRVKEAVDLSVIRAEADARAFYPNVRAAHALTVWHTNPARAVPFVTRAQRLAAEKPDDDRPAWAAWLAGLPIFDLWLNNKSADALSALAEIERTLNGRLGRERDAYATMVGFSYLAFGRSSDSSRAFRYAGSPVRQVNMAMRALVLGDKAGARRWLEQVREHSEVRPAVFAFVGLLEDAERGLAALPPDHHAEGVAEVTRGLIAAKRGSLDAAEHPLRRGVELLRFSGEIEYFLGAEALSRLWMSRGETERAGSLVSDAAGQRGRTYGSTQWMGAYWMKMNAGVARSRRRAGDEEHAGRLEQLLDQLLSHADVDHPLRKATSAVVARTR